MGELIPINRGNPPGLLAAPEPADPAEPEEVDEFATMASFRTDRWLRPV